MVVPLARNRTQHHVPELTLMDAVAICVNVLPVKRYTSKLLVRNRTV